MREDRLALAQQQILEIVYVLARDRRGDDRLIDIVEALFLRLGLGGRMVELAFGSSLSGRLLMMVA